ncbi:MAG TPA: SUMF1/EgtB/PvdO family nonheme iron enzyme, partial [Planctomycetaceae bacterium]|nr:SUMF1/EgtB/PvdO family nonheme iron enzyme [Planctomycetaceae bacterium]
GYERKRSAPTKLQQPDQPPGETRSSAGSDSAPTPPEPELEFPAERPRLKFLMPTRAETLKIEQPPADPGDPISDAELAVPWDKPGLPLRPLVPWARLAPFLKNRLGTSITGTRLDQRKLMRLASKGLPLTELPRLRHTAWAAEAVIFWDHTPEMYPFTQDVVALYRRLKHERGRQGLKVVTLKNVPRMSDIAGIPSGSLILAISAMGQFEQNSAIQAAWLTLGRRLNFRGHTLHSLNPCPRDRWQSSLPQNWSTAVWDRGHRLPRNSSHRSICHESGGWSWGAPTSTTGASLAPLSPAPATRFLNHADKSNDTERLLDLLAPASLIEPPLLREARLLLGRKADAGTEWDAWHHADCWHSLNSFGLRPGERYDERLQRRTELAAQDGQLTSRIAQAMRTQHQTYSLVIAAEAELRACLAGTPDEHTLEQIKALLQRVLDRMRLLAERPGSREGRNNGLLKWPAEMVERLPPMIREDHSIQEWLARSLALAHTWLETPRVELPPGVNAEIFREEARLAALRVRNAREPVDYIVGLNRSSLSFSAASTPIPVAQIRAGGSHRLQMTSTGPPSLPDSLQLDEGNPVEIPFPSLPQQITIESSHGRLHFEAIERPAWASRLWYDRFGIAAEFTIRGVSFILRRIPPGRFLMGSPESEKGRWDPEGPQHEVTISRGFWLGETPVTQAQWQAVVEAGIEQPSVWNNLFPKNALKPKPSKFDGSPLHPVEQVNWHHSTAFCRVMNELVTDGPGFRLPTEGQWEYACRAGTLSAFNNGTDCTVPEGNDPAMDKLGWFDENSEQKTQPVKRKLANAWGLYDMHGNVWEWCVDVWDEVAYKSHSIGVADPVNRGEEGAANVLRGGSWEAPARNCRSAFRGALDSGVVWDGFGLRLSAGQSVTEIDSIVRIVESRTVLVAEDSRTQSMLFRSMLEKGGYRAVMTSNGREALESIRSSRPDVVITDLNMPEMDGLGLIEAVHSEFPNIPVILVTAVGSEAIAAEALQKGAASYIPKRSLTDLIPTLERVLTLALERSTALNQPRLGGSAIRSANNSVGQSTVDGQSTVLVVEDSRTQSVLFRSMLVKAGYRAVMTSNGREALESIRNSPPHVVITDLDLPEMNGLQLLEAVQAEFPNIPVILVTAVGSEAIAAEAIRKGAASYVPKRNLKDLIPTLQRLLGSAPGSGILEPRQPERKNDGCGPNPAGLF